MKNLVSVLCCFLVSVAFALAEDICSFGFENGIGNFWVSDAARVNACVDDSEPGEHSSSLALVCGEQNLEIAWAVPYKANSIYTVSCDVRGIEDNADDAGLMLKSLLRFGPFVEPIDWFSGKGPEASQLNSPKGRAAGGWQTLTWEFGPVPDHFMNKLINGMSLYLECPGGQKKHEIRIDSIVVACRTLDPGPRLVC